MRNEEETTYNNVTAERLRQDRMSRGYTQQEVADAIGVGVDHYKKLEAGTKNLKLWRLQKLATNKNITMDVEYIIFGTKKDDKNDNEDNLEKEFFRFVRNHKGRETQLREIILNYIGRLIQSVKDTD